MKFAKLISTAAALAVSAAAFACTAGAELVVPSAPTTAVAESGTGMFKCLIYQGELGIAPSYKLSDIASFTYTITVDADNQDWFEGNTGGALVVSCGPTDVTPEDHNWIQTNYWGVVDEDLEIDTHNPDEPIQAVKVGDYTYSLTCTVDETNCPYDVVTEQSNGWCALCLSEWGSDMAPITVQSLEINDASGNVLAKYDGNGNIVEGVTAAPADTTAPADSTTPATTAPDKGSPDKGSPDTGVEGVAAVAGIAALAAGAVVIARKRK